MLPIVAAGQKTLGCSDSPWHGRLFSMSNQRKILDLPVRWWCRDDSDELLPCAMTSGGNVGNFIIQSFPLFFSRSPLAGMRRKPMIPGDFHQYKIRFEPICFSIFTCVYNLCSFFSPHVIGWKAVRGARNNSCRTLCAGTAGDFEGTRARREAPQCQKCRYKSSRCRFMGDRLSYDKQTLRSRRIQGASRPLSSLLCSPFCQNASFSSSYCNTFTYISF